MFELLNCQMATQKKQQFNNLTIQQFNNSTMKIIDIKNLHKKPHNHS